MRTTSGTKVHVFLCALLAAAAASCGLAGQVDAAPVLKDVSVGFEGSYKTGFWTPVQIVVVGGDTDARIDLSVTTLDSDGVPVRHEWAGRQAVQLAAGRETTIRRLVKMGRAKERMRVSVRDSGRDDAPWTSRSFALPSPLSSDRELILSLGKSIGVEQAVTRRGRVSDRGTVVHSLDEAHSLPETWLGYESVAAVVASTSDATWVEQMSDAQLEALRTWVELGGRLILCVGSRGAELVSSSGRLAAFAPGDFREVAVMLRGSSLESYTGSAGQLDSDSVPRGIPLTVLGNVRGKTDLVDAAPSGPRPLIIRAPLGLGRVTFVGLDLDLPPFTEWDGRSRLVDRVLREATGRQDIRAEDAGPGHSVQFGYEDMSGQLRSAMDQYPGVTMVAFSWIAGLVLLYVILIGPVDFFLLRDGLKRMHWTWISFPLVVLAFVAGTRMLNERLQGGDLKLNQLDLIDIDASTSTVRGTSWAQIYSPVSARYDIEAEFSAEAFRAAERVTGAVAWHGLPGSGLGGLDGGTAVPVATDEYQLAFTSEDVSPMNGVPFPVGSTRGFLGRWRISLAGEAETTLSVDADGLLRGELVNPLNIPLSDCMVLYENWVYRLDSRRGVLAPGERLRIETERGLNLQWRLSGRKVIDTKDVSTPWDLNTLDVWKILEMMMFHGAAGGETYTHLANRYQGYLDLSSHLTTGRAVLWGRAARGPTEWTVNGRTASDEDRQHWTCYRVVFPVTPLEKAKP